MKSCTHRTFEVQHILDLVEKSIEEIHSARRKSWQKKVDKRHKTLNNRWYRKLKLFSPISKEKVKEQLMQDAPFFTTHNEIFCFRFSDSLSRLEKIKHLCNMQSNMQSGTNEIRISAEDADLITTWSSR